MPVDARLLLQSEPQPTAMQSLGQVFALRGKQQEQEIEGFKLQQMQQQVQAQKALDAAMMNATSDEDIENRIKQAGLGHLVPDIRKKFADANHARQQALSVGTTNAMHKQDYTGSLAAAVQVLPEEHQPAAFVEALSKGVREGIYTPDEAHAYLQRAQDVGLPDLLKSAVQGSPKQREVLATEERAKHERSAQQGTPAAYVAAVARRDAYAADPENNPKPPPGDEYMIKAFENAQAGKGSQKVKEDLEMERLINRGKAAQRGDPGVEPLTPQDLDRIETWKEQRRSGANSLPDEDIDTLARMLIRNQVTVEQMSKRQDYGRILARANRISVEETGQGYSPAKQSLEYSQAKHQVATLSNTQNMALERLGGTLKRDITRIQELADELKQGGVQKWNQLKRSTIQQVWGNSPQSQLATRYLTEIENLKGGLVQFENGGFAGQAAGWDAINKQLNADAGFKDLSASLDEILRDVNFKLQAHDELKREAGMVTRNPFGGNAGAGRSPLKGGGGGAPADPFKLR